MPTLASTSRVSVAYKPETTFGVTPAAGTHYYELRVTGESLDFTVAKTQSSEINANRAVSSQTPTSASAQGGVQAEFSHGEYDRLMQGAVQNTYVASGTNGSVSIGNTTTTTFSTGAISFSANVTHGLVAGQWFRMSKYGGTNDGKLFRVHASSSITPISIPLDAGTPAIAEGASANWFLQAARLTNGTTQSSFSIQRTMNDMSPLEYMVYRGMTTSKFSLNIASGSLTTISFDFMGKDGLNFSGANNPLSKGIKASDNTLDTGTSTSLASLTYGTHSGVTATNCVIWKSGAPLTATLAKSITLDYDNSLAVQEAVCSLGAVGIRSGNINCSVTMQMYFASGATFFSEFLGNSNFELAFSTVDSTGQAYVFTLPAANVSTYKVNAGGKDNDLLVDVTFAGLRGGSLDKVLIIDRCGAAVTL